MMPFEATVCQSYGSRSVSLSTHTLTRERSKRSRSATICWITVVEPWPISVSPRFTITLASEFILTITAVPVNGGMAGALCSAARPLPILRPVRCSCAFSSAVSPP